MQFNYLRTKGESHTKKTWVTHKLLKRKPNPGVCIAVGFNTINPANKRISSINRCTYELETAAEPKEKENLSNLLSLFFCMSIFHTLTRCFTNTLRSDELWVARSQQRKVLGSNPSSVAFLCGFSLCTLGFLPQSKNNHVRLTGDSKLAVAVDMIMTVVWSVTDWPPACVSQLEQTPTTTLNWRSGRKWINKTSPSSFVAFKYYLHDFQLGPREHLIQVSRLANPIKPPQPPHYSMQQIHLLLYHVHNVVHEMTPAKHHMDTDHRTAESFTREFSSPLRLHADHFSISCL